MALETYRSKRNFNKSLEPRGRKILRKSRKTASDFVVQLHAARNLHYDFRLELDGVLKSWAVPKGPSLDPLERRLAVQVEDHPLDYAKFEGKIPKGEYGAGSVIIWDQGKWIAKGNPSDGLKKGRLSFELFGERLRGRWLLLRLRDGKNWLLVKQKDGFAGRDRQKKKILSSRESVVSHRSLEEIATENVERHSRLTSPRKILFPDPPITKADLAHYYEIVAPEMLKHMAGRPLMILRCTEARAKKCFFQKNWQKGLPESIRSKRTRGGKSLLVVEDQEGLIDLAQISALEIHSWASRFNDLEHPDLMTIDLDPDPTVPWKKVVEVAFRLKKLLETLKLPAYPKFTGGKGVHIVSLLDSGWTWRKLKSFARALCTRLVKEDPQLLLLSMNKKARRGKIFLDYLRNGRGATAIVPFSPRNRDRVPLAVPTTWAELKRSQGPDHVHISEIRKIARILHRHPWGNFELHGNSRDFCI